MFKELSKYIVGDKLIWAFTILISIGSFLVVSSVGYNSTKHAAFILLGLVVMFFCSLTRYTYWNGIARVLFFCILPVLAYTAVVGQTIGGANAARWVRIPVIGITFQPSAPATILLMIYLSRNLYRLRERTFTFKESIIPIVLPIVVVCALVLPGNLSTTIIIFGLSLLIISFGGYPIRYILIIIGFALLGLSLFVIMSKLFPEVHFLNRVDTWESRFMRFFTDVENEDTLQVDRAYAAIVRGGAFGVGAGKSALKAWLPQSNSDFIFAMVIEEYGLVFGVFPLLFCYLMILWRVIVTASKFTEVDIRGTLLMLSVGLPMIIQAFTNMFVAVGLFPVTGQTLPLISEGGTSILITFGAIGIMLSTSNGLNNVEPSEPVVPIK